MEWNRSFARRVGKKLSPTNKKLLTEKLPLYEITEENLEEIFGTFEQINLEIGFGDGAHFANQAEYNLNTLFIGFEPYLNGVANALKLLFDKGLENFKISADDVDILIDKIPQNSVDQIFILFPDPWHNKRRHNKRRILNSARLEYFHKILKKNGHLNFASDIEDYVKKVTTLFHENPNFLNLHKGEVPYYSGYEPTKYHLKALEEGRTPEFLTYRAKK